MSFIRATLAILFGLVLVPACGDRPEFDARADAGPDAEVTTFGQTAQAITWPSNLGSCQDRPAGPDRNKSGYGQAGHISPCYLQDKLPIYVQVVDNGVRSESRQAWDEAINDVFVQTGNVVYFVYDLSGGMTPDIVVDLNDPQGFLGVTYGTLGAVSIDPWNGARRLASRVNININEANVRAQWGMYRDKYSSACWVPLQTYVNQIVMHELMHAIGLSHDNYGQNQSNMASADAIIPSITTDTGCHGTQNNTRGKLPNLAGTMIPAEVSMLQAYFANNSSLPELQ